jgi:hypothetical protein
MEFQKFNVKIFVTEPNNVPLTDFIEIFHGWIQATDGIYHDVADYSHMQSGPGIVLVANDANLHIDDTGGRRGLLYCRKAPLSGTNQDKLRTVFRLALENCRKLEDEPVLRGKLRFLANEVTISLSDRLIAANTVESFEELKSDVEPFAKQLFDGSKISFGRDADPRQRLNVRVKTSAAIDLSQTLDRLQHN